MKKKSGFTLIELLAVIVILAIIALISTPIIIGVIEKARKGAFEDSAYGILDAGRIYFIDKLADQNKFEGATFAFPDGGDLKISGEKPAGGNLVLDTDGKQALALYDKDKKWCALKAYNEEKITIKDYKEEECRVSENASIGSVIIKDKNVSGNTEGLFLDDFGNVRYRGNDSTVKNYVKFNNEVWRIIGVFNDRIKLVREEKLPNPNDVSHPDTFLWNTANTNDWSTSDLQIYLNGNYYNSMNTDSKNFIENEKYNLGGIANSLMNKKRAYELERGTTVSSGRPTEWTGKIALPYVSDYGYAAGSACTQDLNLYSNTECKENNWLYNSSYDWWGLTPLTSSASGVSMLVPSGYVTNHSAGIVWKAVHPTLFLKASVKITGGNGTSSNPYQLSL